MIFRHLHVHRWFCWFRWSRVDSTERVQRGAALGLSHVVALPQPSPAAHGLLKPLCFTVCLALSACAAPPREPGPGHLRPSAQPQGKPPELVDALLLPPQPRPGRTKAEVYSVSVHNLAIRDLLFALARDARINLDVHPDLAGTVSINAIDQTITEILDRAAMQVDMRYEMEGRNLFVMPDSPVLRHYRVDYPNVSRESRSSVSASSSIGGSGAGNSSSSSMANTSNNRFWDTLTQNIRDLLRETDKQLPEETGAAPVAAPAANALGAIANPAASPAAPTAARFREAASVIANPETGVLSVRASFRQHLRIREFMDRVMLSAGRQVMIEATIVEVNLSDQYQQGINWSVFRRGLPLFQLGPAGANMPSGVPMSGVIPSMAAFTPTYTSASGLTQISAAVRLLESFGNTKVLSSPKISALNNQAALLKVTEDIVYFTLTSTFEQGTNGAAGRMTVTSNQNTVSVGFVMSVMPQVGENDQVTLILRPTLSRVAGYVNDPAVSINLAMARAGGSDVPEVVSRVPQIQTRELESVIKVRSGDTAVLGGLMRENFTSSTDQTPGLGSLPGLGELFKYKSRDNGKSELVIFLRPTVVTDASLEGDYQTFQPHLSEALRAMPEQSGVPFGLPQSNGRQP
ncbi:MAG: type II and III secretion system protein [Hydrogenophaga sp.]|uniref:type II secretion system protein GspD n=1 Tax=Hydrogenophaga sp. TaxID=1904254 RepID=UPI0027749F10|nr:type II and III secretion system protein [Hydrogenophaga sp.]MDP2418237.1 type II and III secretion system protein [Hydrogenophaga sp.]MDZ4187186.1 type II and III secretion system protein [Hydrogenophaga sp.]